MALTLTTEEIDDMVKSTLGRMDPPKFSQIATDLQRYEVMSRWLKKDRVVLQGGRRIEDTFMDKTEGVAEHKGHHEPDNVRIGVHLAEMNVPWRTIDTHWGWDRKEVLMNMGRALRVKILSPRRAAAMIDLAKQLEVKAFGAAPATTDEVDPYGIQFWVVTNATAGFNGAYPGSWTLSNYPIDLTAHPNQKNYSGTYAAYNDDNLLEQMRVMHDETDWESPITMKDFYQGFGQDLRYYCNQGLRRKFRRLARLQNDNLGLELDAFRDPVFNRHQIVRIPYLDNNEPNTDTVFQIDHRSFKISILQGDYLRQTGPQQVAGHHNDQVIFIDLTYNYRCLDRRRQGALYYAAA
jgi:hypothetical protein